MDRSDLITSFQDTLTMSLSSALKEATEQSSQSSKVYLENFNSYKERRNLTGKIVVEENTSFAAAKAYLSEGKTAVLNFANPVTPGGGAKNGAMAQEECLCRSSNLYACLTSSTFADYYHYNRELHNHFYSDRLIYTEGVTVFKNDDIVPVLMPEHEWFRVDVITCAAPYIAKRRYTNMAALKALFKGRIKNIFEAAIDHDIEVLILGAFGCGAFKNPPEVVAKAFKEVIEENQYGTQFKKIVFAIKSTVNSDPFVACPNIMAFETEFYGLSAEANKLRFSDPWPLAQAIGSVEMPSGKILKGGEAFNPYREWQNRNKYSGKQFSILGDSISTLESYNPKGYNLFYTGDACERTGVKDMKDTWWGKVIDYFGAELLVNNSWSGSRVTKLPQKDKLFPSGCSDERTGGLHIGSVMPDVIIVYLGTNDWFYGAQVEEERKGFHDANTGVFVDGYIQGDETVFSVAYTKMLDKLKSNYPAAEIFCCTLNETYMASKPSFVFPHAHGGTHIDCYNDVIRRLAALKGCSLIDLSGAHLPYDAVDGSHPTETGMRTLASLILHGMCEREGLAFMECSHSDHEFVTAEEYTGGTKYVCRKCGLVDHYNMINPAVFEGLYAGSTVNGNQLQRTGMNIVRCENGHFYDSNRYECCPHCHAKRQDNVAEKKEDTETQTDLDIIDLDPECTTLLYSPEMGIRLFSVSKEDNLTIYKTEFHAGRGQDCELRLTNSYVARIQATFMLHGNCWLLRDNHSINGTWLNDTKLIPGKKYVLHPDDVIDFAHSEKFIFYKTEQQHNQGNEDEKAIAFLEAGIKVFHDSDHKDETAFKLIIAALTNAPLYLPVAIDIEAMLGGVDPTKLKPGDVLQPSKDVRMKVQTITVNNTEFIPLFTSSEEVNKGPAVSMMRMYPQDYLPKIMQMGKDVVINPFGGKAFIYNQKMIKELVWPVVQQKTQKSDGVQVKKPDDDLVGQMIADRYELISSLGRGSYFQVYLARNKSNKECTVKVCNKNAPGMSDTMRTLLLQEPHLMMKFNHPAIPKVIDIIEDEQHLFVVREYIEGETLSNLITKNGSLAAEKTISLGIELAGALQYLHSFNPPYIYRDMKPANVMVMQSGDIKLIDFGICEVQGIEKNDIIEVYGTRGYAAPEQFMGKYDPRTDIFSLGITMHHCVTGINPVMPPYETPPICKVNPSLSKGLEYIICRCTELNPDNRYQSCAELIEDLRNYQNLPPKKGLFANLFGKKQ